MTAFKRFCATITLIGCATSSLAAIDQSGFPASCRIYAACEDDTCVRVYHPLGYVYLVEENGALFMAPSVDGQRTLLGWFDSLYAASDAVSSDTAREYGAQIIANDVVSDGFGMNLHPVSVSGAGETTVSNMTTKLVCSAVNGSLY